MLRTAQVTDAQASAEIITALAPRLVDKVIEHLRVHHYSLSTERTYLQWIRRFILHHDKRHPRDMGALAKDEGLGGVKHQA